MAVPKKAVLALMAHAARMEVSNGFEGWVAPPRDLYGKCRALVRDGMLEENDGGFFKPTKLGAMSALDVESIQ